MFALLVALSVTFSAYVPPHTYNALRLFDVANISPAAIVDTGDAIVPVPVDVPVVVDTNTADESLTHAGESGADASQPGGNAMPPSLVEAPSTEASPPPTVSDAVKLVEHATSINAAT
jgi:hypothetical protein